MPRASDLETTCSDLKGLNKLDRIETLIKKVFSESISLLTSIYFSDHCGYCDLYYRQVTAVNYNLCALFYDATARWCHNLRYHIAIQFLTYNYCVAVY